MDSAATLLSVKNLCLSIGGHELLNNIDLDIEEGAFVTLTGKSGCGKTLLARSIASLYPAGQISLKGKITFKDLPLERSRIRSILGKEIGMVFQHAALSFDPVMKCGKQMIEAVRNHENCSREEAETKVRSWLPRFQLTDVDKFMNAYPHELSGGQLQRISLAAATIHKPALLVADEATSALDRENEDAIIALINELRGELGMAVLWISHNLPLSLSLSDKIYIMEAGKIVEKADMQAFSGLRHHPATLSLLGAVYKPIQKNKSNNRRLLTIENLSKKFAHQPVLQDFSMQVNEGQRIAITGPSGSGKSTLARIICGVESFDAGSLQWLGQEKNQKVQMIFQHPALSLNPKMTIAQSLAEPYQIHRLPHDRQTLVNAMLEVGLEEMHLDRYPDQLSGGQLQRVCIARSLSLKPQLLILDEAVTALDAVTRTEILTLLDKVYEQHNMAYLMITHDHELANDFCDTLIPITSNESI